MATNQENLFNKIKTTLNDLYGSEGGERFDYLHAAAERFLANRSEKQITENKIFNSERPYEKLSGKIFAIAYPDNVYKDDEYPLQTLNSTLKTYFPSVKGIHILPERTMSHNDVWPQDFFELTSPEKANEIIEALSRAGIIDSNRIVTDKYDSLIDSFETGPLRDILGSSFDETAPRIRTILNAAWNSHFNDGGFSQKTREIVDPRFGQNSHLEEITEDFATMLDYVVNHLDVDNDSLEEFRKGNSEGDAFVIIYRDRYKQLLGDRTLDKTFRPRPFPLFTGLRKYPISGLEGDCLSPENCASEMNRIFTANELEPLDPRLILFMSIYFKVENDQGLTSEDRRIFKAFDEYATQSGIDTSSFWEESQIQAKQKKINFSVLPDMEAFLSKMGLDVRYADIFMNDCDHIFGREFYVYTTFSESQADVNPLTMDGFRMIIDDLFHLLSSGALTMMRMDAIKYLWKEIGQKNFDMEEGNKLISVIRDLMEAVSPSTLPLDEINSPDPVVYKMAEGGGFAYLFGQVNAVPAAFNEASLEPLIRFNATKKEKCPENLLPFVMLSTHDGRSVQGLGVQRSDGHVSVEQFYNLKDIVESRGGKPKFRSVATGEIAGDTFRKVFDEAGYKEKKDSLKSLFEEDLIKEQDLYRLKDRNCDESDLLEELASRLDTDVRNLAGSPAIDYFIQWIIYGKTAYELCCTSRSAFSTVDGDGNSLTEEEEARRLAAAQLFVLTQGQDVPAIYFNDLLGLENDVKSYGISGRPRDLNRHKNQLDEMISLMETDPFTKSYVEKINTLLKLRAEDGAFYPGSSNFQFLALENSVYLHHPWQGEEHSLILGNILNKEIRVSIPMSELKDWKKKSLKDQINGTEFSVQGDSLSVTLEPYGYLWLK